MPIPGDDTVINYDFAGMDTLSGDLRANFAKLGSLAEELRTQVTQLAVNWTSPEGAGAYQTAQGKWDAVFEEARNRLNGLGQGVETAAVTMNNADKRVRDTFC